MPLLVIFRACTAIVLIVLMSAAHAPAQESRPASQEAINKLVEQLGADDSPARAAAQKTLRELGEAARAAVEKAAQSPDLEVRQRAGALLTELNNKAIAKNIVWSLALEKTASAPVFHDGKAFVCANGQLMALEPKTGKKLWSFGEFGDDHPNLSSPVAGGAVVVVNAEGSLHAFDPATGKRLWKFAPTDEESSAADSPVLPAVADGVVHFATGKKLRAVDAATGKDKWSADCEIRSIGRPAVVDGAMCLMSAEGLYAFDIKTGKSLWDRKSPLCSRLTPAGGVILAVDGASLVALDGKTGKEIWAHPLKEATWQKTPIMKLVINGRNITPPSPIEELTVVDGVIPLAVENRLWAVSLKDGKALWEHHVEGLKAGVPEGAVSKVTINQGGMGATVVTDNGGNATPRGLSPSAAKGLLLIPLGRSLAAVDGKTGKIVWSLEMGTCLFGAVTITDGVAYFSTVGEAEGEAKPALPEGVHAIKLKNGD